jgi:uncharacterized coiled-coil DUF342 family protein
VQARQLSLDALGKSYRELRKQLDLCNERIDEVWKERAKLQSSLDKIAISIKTLDSLMSVVFTLDECVTIDEKNKIKNKLEELRGLQAERRSRDTELWYLLLDSVP